MRISRMVAALGALALASAAGGEAWGQGYTYAQCTATHARNGQQIGFTYRLTATTVEEWDPASGGWLSDCAPSSWMPRGWPMSLAACTVNETHVRVEWVSTDPGMGGRRGIDIARNTGGYAYWDWWWSAGSSTDFAIYGGACKAIDDPHFERGKF